MNELKSLKEKRNDLYVQLEKLVNDAEAQTRALNDEETKKFEDLEKQIKDLDATIAMKERIRTLERNDNNPNANAQLETEKRDIEDFAKFIRAQANNQRAEDVNFTQGDNGSIIPQTISKKIIETVEDICPIYEWAEKYNIAGKLKLPKYVETDNAVTMDYAEDFVELTASAGKFETIELDDYLAGCLTKISLSLVNKVDFDVTQYVISKVALAISRFLEKECLIGTEGKIEGLLGVKLEVAAENADSITSDDLIDLQEEIRDQFQSDTKFIMNRTTRKAIRKLKDGDGNYLLNRDFEAKWNYRLLGRDVYTSDIMPEIGAGNKVIYYGDFSGLAAKIVENAQIKVLTEKYATQHAIGVVTYLDIDCKVQDEQKIAVLKCAASDTSDTSETDEEEAG